MEEIEKFSYKVFKCNDGDYNVSGGLKSNSPTGWANFSGHNFKTELEVANFLFNKTIFIRENNFVYIVEDRKGYEQGYFSTREKAEQKIKDIQSQHREALVVNCQKIY